MSQKWRRCLAGWGVTLSQCDSHTGRGRQLVVWDVIKTFPTLALIQRLHMLVHNLSLSSSISGCNGLALNIFFLESLVTGPKDFSRSYFKGCSSPLPFSEWFTRTWAPKLALFL